MLTVLTFPDQASVAPYLVIPVADRCRWTAGGDGLLRVTARRVRVPAGAAGRWSPAAGTASSRPASFTWLTAGAGHRHDGRRPAAGSRAARTRTRSYRSAVGLIRRLEALSGKLSGGLDAVGIAEQIMDEADSVIPTRSAGVFVRSATGSMAPLRYSVGTQPGAMALGRAALGQVLGVRGDDAARTARRHPADRQRRDDRRARARRPAEHRLGAGPRPARPARAGTPCSSRLPCCSVGCGTTR